MDAAELVGIPPDLEGPERRTPDAEALVEMLDVEAVAEKPEDAKEDAQLQDPQHDAMVELDPATTELANDWRSLTASTDAVEALDASTSGLATH